MDAEAASAEERSGTFDASGYAGELADGPTNHAIGTTLLLENDHVRVFELRLEPGERAPFHVHDASYFWTVVDAGRGRQRFSDGTWIERSYTVGETRFLVHSADEYLVHDLENVGDTTLRFVTVELRR